MMEIEVNRFSIYKTTSFVEFSDYIHVTFLDKGAFNNYVDRILPFIAPPPARPALRGQFLYPERGEKQTFFDPLPPHLVHVVIEWPLS